MNICIPYALIPINLIWIFFSLANSKYRFHKGEDFFFTLFFIMLLAIIIVVLHKRLTPCYVTISILFAYGFVILIHTYFIDYFITFLNSISVDFFDIKVFYILLIGDLIAYYFLTLKLSKKHLHAIAVTVLNVIFGSVSTFLGSVNGV